MEVAQLRVQLGKRGSETQRGQGHLGRDGDARVADARLQDRDGHPRRVVRRRLGSRRGDVASCFRICRGEIVPGSAEKETHAHLSKYDAFRGIQLLLQALDEIKSYNERHERIDRAEIGRPDSSKNALTPGEQAELAAFQELQKKPRRGALLRRGVMCFF